MSTTTRQAITRGPAAATPARTIATTGEHQVISDAHVRTTREHLGLSAHDLAALLGVAERTVRRWEAGTHPVPAWGRAQLEVLQAEATSAVDAMLLALHERDQGGPPAVVTYRSDADYWRAHPHQRPHPASWHRALTARVAQVMPTLAVTYRP